MFRRKKPSARESVLAGATLESLMESESLQAGNAPGMAALAALIPSAAIWRRENRRGDIRLIDLERRACFARPLTDAT